MSQPNYKLLILDYGGVYSHGYDKETQNKIARELFASERPPTASSPELTSLEDRFSSGIVTTQEYIDELAMILNAPQKPTPDELQARMLLAAKDPTPLMVELVADVRSKGITTVLLSDMCAFEIPIAEGRHRFDGFDLALLSAREGVSKKNERFFELVFERMPFEPSDAIFFDDSEYCIKTARAMGIESEHVVGEEMETAEGLSRAIHRKLFD